MSAPLESGGSGARPAGFWRSLPDDLVTAARGVVSSPSYSASAVLSVLLGVGATVVIYAVFNAVVLRPLPFAHQETLVALFDDLNAPGMDRTVISLPELSDYAGARSLAAIGTYVESEGTVTGLGEPRHSVITQCTPNFFDTLGVSARLGRAFSGKSERDDVGAAVVSEGFWLSALGGAPPLGRTIVVEGLPRTIIGVLPAGQALPASTDIWIPLKPTPEQATHRGYRFMFAVARLAGGASLASAQRDLDGISQNVQRALGSRARRVRAVVVPLREHLLGDSYHVVELLLAAVAVFLLLSATNVASLLLTRTSVRNHELAVRAALGAGPARLVCQSLLEALLLVVAGGALGLALAVVAVHTIATVYADLLEYSLPRIDANVALVFVAVCLFTVLATGLLPALRAAKVRSMDALRQSGRGSAGRGMRRLRESLVGVQVGACVILLIAAASLIRSVVALTSIDPGFSIDGVVAGRISLPAQKYGDDDKIRQFYERAVDSLRVIPGAQAVSTASLLPLMDSYAVRITLESQPTAADSFHAEQRQVTPGVFATLSTPLVAGRVVNDADRPDTERVAVVNQAFAKKLLAGTSAIGARFDTGAKTASGETQWLRIVGVVADSHDFGLDAPARPTFFMPFAQAPTAEASVVVRARGIPDAEIVRQIRERIHAIDPDLPVYKLTTLRESLQSSYRSRTVLTYLLVAISAAALLLACVGLFGVTSYSVSQRRSELAIRRALGASRLRIVRMVMVETAVVVLAGVVIGLASASFSAHVLSSLIVGLTGTDAVTLAAAAVVAFVVSMLAALPPSLNAATVELGSTIRG